ncbi:MAG: hypothetical protein HY454_01020, partial [Parcubacteria group bacterium]|nr:hypothetical protein [Parcubacteria group bacterium]
MKSGVLVFLGLAVAVAAAYWLWGAPKSSDYGETKLEANKNITPSAPTASDQNGPK